MLWRSFAPIWVEEAPPRIVPTACLAHVWGNHQRPRGPSEDHRRNMGGPWCLLNTGWRNSRIVNCVQCHYWLSGLNDYHEFRSSTVCNVMSTISQNHVMSLSLLQGSRIALEVFPKCNLYCHMSERSHISGIALWRCSLNCFVFVFNFVLITIMSQRSQVSRIALWRCSLSSSLSSSLWSNVSKVKSLWGR